MQEIFGIGIMRDNQKDYCWTFESLAEIDSLFLNYSKEQILLWMKEADSVISETDSEKLVIEQCIHHKWKPLSDFIITDSFILTFSFSELFQKEDSRKVLNILYNHFQNFLQKNYISDAFKETIRAMKVSDNCFLQALQKCSYVEERKIRLYLSKRLDLHSILEPENEKSFEADSFHELATNQDNNMLYMDYYRRSRVKGDLDKKAS